MKEQFKQIIYALSEQLAFEKEMLKVWTKGEDMSLFPPNWSLEKQEFFVRGMEHSLQIIKNEINSL